MNGTKYTNRKRRNFPIVAHLAAFGSAILIPIIALSVIVLVQGAEAERRLVAERAQELARSVAFSINQQITAHINILHALASSPALDIGDMSGFYSQVAAIAKNRQSIIVLRTPDSRQIINSGLPFGAAKPQSTLRRYDEEALRTEKPVVSGLFRGAVDPSPQYAVVVPVLRDEKVIYFLSSGVRTEKLIPLMKEHAGPDFYVNVRDARGDALASLSPSRVHGLSSIWSSSAEARDGGEASGVIWESAPAKAAGWAVEIGVPRVLYYAPIWQRAFSIGLVLLVLVVIAAAVVFLFSRQLGRSLRHLAGMAGALERADKMPLLVSGITEIDNVATVLVAAGQERERREAALREARDDAIAAKAEAEAATRAKSAFLAAASHDLRQPFQAMRLLQHVLEAKAGPELEAAVKGLGSAMLSGEELLAALLDVSVLDSGTVNVDRTRFSVAELLREVVEECAPLAQAAGLDLRMVPCSAAVVTDRVLFKRMLRNLVVNALRYTKTGGVLLGCRRRRGRLFVQVVDTGIGIPADFRRRIFEDFYQIGNEERDRNRGLGLGLGIVSRLSRLLGHPVTLSSVAGRGSIFSIEMEAAKD